MAKELSVGYCLIVGWAWKTFFVYHQSNRDASVCSIESSVIVFWILLLFQKKVVQWIVQDLGTKLASNQ